MSRQGDPSRFLNRELSWLEFNGRVLEEACDDAVPLLERVRFLAITASNLDEFFMVRVGGLRMLADRGRSRRDISGLTPRDQLSEIGRRVHDMVDRQYACLDRELEPALERASIRRIPWNRTTSEHAAHLGRIFEQELLPLLTPRAIDPDQEFPLIPGLTLHLAVRLRRDGPAAGASPGEGWAVVGIPRTLSRFYTVPAEAAYHYVLVEDIVRGHLDRLFPGCEILDTAVFRITRNADMSVVEDLAADLLARMQDVLVARRESDCVRLEIEAGADPRMTGWLRRRLEADEAQVYRVPGPLALSSWFGFGDLHGFDALKSEPWPPQPSPLVPARESMFTLLDRRDVILYAPFESYDPVVRFVEEAAADPNVLAIKQILYRTSKNSPIVAALARAAAEGKQVTALVELKARFDEARNIEWARALERAGVQVIYGIRGFKTHAKVCLVVRREPQGIRRYVHFSTGNYNEMTAQVYGDVSLMTAAEDCGADASAFFNTITGITQPGPYRRIEAAPLGLRRRVLDLIEGEVQRCRQGRRARIVVKVNSLADPELIEALYRASQAGVKVDCLVRGICCLRPGVKKFSENIRVFSVVDRFLEHARILYFHQDGDPALFISSADWMPRNLDKRIELLVAVVDPACRKYLTRVLDTCLADNVKARRLRPDGTYERVKPTPRTKPLRSQAALYDDARRAAKSAEDSGKAVFVPHRPAKVG
jgi:polyphosphate kinase